MSSEIRRNPLSKEYVIIAQDRGNRPFDYKAGPIIIDDSSDHCNFCPGHEAETEQTILAHNSAAGWTQRVFANKYRAFDIEGELNRQKHGLFWSMNARGAQELIVATPRHVNIYALTDEEALGTLLACQERIIDLKQAKDAAGDPKLSYILIFVNEGWAAGASKKHAHFQLFGLPIIPKVLREEFDNTEKYWEDNNTCLLCDLVKQEREAKERVVLENDVFLSVCAYAAKFPYETWILPKSHLPIFEDGTEKTLKALAEIIMGTLRRLDKVLPGAAFNPYLHDAPLFDRNHDRMFDFHIEIVMRLSQPAGFEYGSGSYINPMPPETAAQNLREVG